MNMTSKDIIEKIAKEKLVEEICNNIAKDDDFVQDLCQDIYIELLAKPPEKIEELYKKKQLKYFIIRMVSNNFNSKTSRFYYKYKKNWTDLISLEEFLLNYTDNDDERNIE